VLLSLLAPTMTCAIPGAQMTAAEHSCCKQMMGKCGTMQMPVSHSCCKTKAESKQPALMQPPVVSFASQTVGVVVAAQLFTARLSSLGYVSLKKAEHPPPRLRPLPSLLRI
jgi:hypothetical protein